MRGVLQGACRIVLLAIVAVTLGGWFDSEATQRKAFIDFLQTQIVSRPGIHVPKLRPEDEKAFGPYTAHYDVITAFVSDPMIGDTLKKMVTGLPPISSAQMVVDQRVKIRGMNDELGAALKIIDEKYAATKAARAALKQPDDLRAVYDKAFDKLVDAPLHAFQVATPLTQQLCIVIADLADYASTHSKTVKINGNSFSPSDAKTQAELNKLIDAVQAKGKVYSEAMKQLQAALYGS